MGYDPAGDAPEESATPGERIDALCLAVLQDRSTWHGESSHCARAKPAAVDATLDRIDGEPLEIRRLDCVMGDQERLFRQPPCLVPGFRPTGRPG
ncbi:hypothetical protein [Streptomyces erythrochromogenes]|uniref:hypothetical protein n=1 Tax=Streptomyces erythrochromogenes TaxID=285574 RepID=UPI00386362AD|nr:hypothetical protein OG364_01760 [Streptomyces erythrochromogenes]